MGSTDYSIRCPRCGEGADVVDSERLEEPAVDFTVASSSEIVSAKTLALLEYTFKPCGHSFYGTQDQGEGENLRQVVSDE